ncbi:MAG: prenyltransferase/squalene oxidase repeat-containing protein [Rubripirellula sp.]
MVMHLVLLLVLALISTPAGSKLGKVMLSISQGEVEDAPVEMTEFSITSEDMLNDSDDLADTLVEVDLSEMFETVTLNEAAELAPVDFGSDQIAQVARPMFNGRTGAMKKALMAIYGGTPETQDAVKRGLQWLARNQRKNGSWSMRTPYSDGAFSENEIAATSMALLAFLGDGHTHMKGEHKEVVEKGITFLVGKKDRNGFFARAARGHEKMYAQAQATIAICELYGMTKDSWLRSPAQLAIDFAEDSQSPEGGWRYEPKFDADTSVTGWFVLGLESGRSAGLDVDISILNNVDGYLDTAASFDDAAYSYQANGEPTAAMTAEGLLCRQYISWKRNHPPLKVGINALLDRPIDMQERDVYYWYYATQVLHHYGGSPWRQWNEVMREELPRAQVRGGDEDGSWSPQMDRWGQNSGRLFTTCLSIFCLEVYYRHMPLYKADGEQLD